MTERPSSPSSPFRLTVLISGSGTNLQALIDASTTPTSPLPSSHIIRVISDRKNAYGLERACAASIPTTYHGILPYKKQHPDDSANPRFSEARRAYDADLAKLVLDDRPDLVICAGFMRIVTPAFLHPLESTKTPIINLHPALHGDLVGADCIHMAWEEYEVGKRKKTGVMVHFVIAEVDQGGLVVQEEVDIVGCKDEDELRGRVRQVEHPLIVRGAAVVLDGLAGGRK